MDKKFDLKTLNKNIEKLEAKKAAIMAKRDAATAKFDQEIQEVQAKLDPLYSGKKALEKIAKKQEEIMAAMNSALAGETAEEAPEEEKKDSEPAAVHDEETVVSESSETGKVEEAEPEPAENTAGIFDSKPKEEPEPSEPTINEPDEDSNRFRGFWRN